MAILSHPGGDLEYHLYAEAGSGPRGRAATAGPDLVFLHEGLGSVAQWGRLPARLHRTTGGRALAYSRHGYGGSGGLPPADAGYLTHQALEVLPAVLDGAGIAADPILIGHSDGANIAAIYAAHHRVSACVLIAPHVVYEGYTAAAIESTRRTFDTVRPSLAAFHRDPDALFRAWSAVWLSPEFRGYDISALLPHITAPVLALQGAEDEYGTRQQLDLVAQKAGGPVETVILPGVGHHPHLESLESTSALIDDFCRRHSVIGSPPP